MIVHPEKSFDDFNKVLKELCYLTCEYGIDRIKPSKNDTLQQIKFYQLVHEGWEKAQNLATNEILSIQNEIAEIKNKIKSYNKNNNRRFSKELKSIIPILEARKRKVQFTINAIVWIVFNLKHHIVRRFYLIDGINNIENSSLFKTFEFIDKINQDPNKCAICCDLTTFMHIGDVLIIDLLKKDKKSISIVELKDGVVNAKCQDILSQFYQTECPRNLFFNTFDLDKKEIKQLQRMARQQWRSSAVLSSINTGEGLDISTEKPLKIPDEEFVIESYDDIILDLNYQYVFRIPVARPPFTLLFPTNLIKGLVTGELVLNMCLHIPFWIENLNSKFNQAEIKLENHRKSRKTNLKEQLLEYNGQLVKFTTGKQNGYIGSGILSKILFDFYKPLDAMRPMITCPPDKPDPCVK